MKFSEQLKSRTPLVYGLLGVLWLLVVAWQGVEHERVKAAARSALIYRARDISSTLGLVIRSQRRFGGVVSQVRLESALNELVRPGELNSVALLNASLEVVASAGSPIGVETGAAIGQGERWGKNSVTLVNLVDLGTNVSQDGEESRPTIVLPRREGSGSGFEDRLRPPPRRGPEGDGPGPGPGAGAGGGTNTMTERSGRTRAAESRNRFGRPFWMSEEEYKSVIAKQGLHGFMIVMSTKSYQATCRQDLWLRSIIGLLGGLSAIGLGLAWRNLVKSSDLQMRLVRASELNARLKEMNIAAAGLAHETRNPLNIIRGLAQLISKWDSTSDEIRTRSREITEEVDRVTAQLNEFINYSRPREIRLAPVALTAIVHDVVRALSYDLEDKLIELAVQDENLTVEADEQMLRQVLFNLLMNAIQAVSPKGSIQVSSGKENAGSAWLEVRDNGPGVAVEQREEIFKPYFTTHQNGTGLGLAVVHQIVLAHGWDIHYVPNDPQGANFRLTGLKLSSRT